MKMMTKHNPQAQEDGFHLLLPYAPNHVQELLADFQNEQHGHGLRCWLLELLGEARDPRTRPLFIELLRSRDESFGWRSDRDAHIPRNPWGFRLLMAA